MGLDSITEYLYLSLPVLGVASAAYFARVRSGPFRRTLREARQFLVTTMRQDETAVSLTWHLDMDTQVSLHTRGEMRRIRERYIHGNPVDEVASRKRGELVQVDLFYFSGHQRTTSKQRAIAEEYVRRRDALVENLNLLIPRIRELH